MRMKHILGTVTVVAIIGGTIYAIKKSKDLEKSEAQEITLDEAREIVAEKEFDKEYNKHFNDNKDEIYFTSGPIIGVKELDEEEMDTLIDGVRETAEFNRSFIVDEEDEDGVDETIEGPEIDDNDIGQFTEEDRILRYEPSSMDALKQFKRMELADIAVYNSEDYQTMLRLFEFPFQPITDGDELLRTQIIDYRVRFFGFGSKWVQQITFADVILHYARAAHFNCDESVAYWVEYFLSFNDLYYTYSANSIDATINTLNAHQYYNDERQTFGLFGLTSNAYDNAIKIANRNIDSSVTYEIEFQEFLKSLL